ncbi:hypothetical protein F1652_10855 [Pluralibacter gergoviae]|nr:hypothetical protein [Pluralibacter gergoviae]
MPICAKVRLLTTVGAMPAAAGSAALSLTGGSAGGASGGAALASDAAGAGVTVDPAYRRVRAAPRPGSARPVPVGRLASLVRAAARCV